MMIRKAIRRQDMPNPILFSSISELYTDYTGRRMGDVIDRLEQKKKVCTLFAHTT